MAILALGGCLERRPPSAPPMGQLRPIDPELPAAALGEPQPPPQPAPGSSDAPPPTASPAASLPAAALPAAQPAPAATPAATPPQMSPAVAAAQARVKPLVDRLLAENRNLGLKPAFLITDQPEPVVQRREFERVFLSEGLVRSCTSDGQLAGLLALQLADLYVARRQQMQSDLAANGRNPPPTVTMIREYGSIGNPDMIHLAEIAILGLDKRAPRSEPCPEAHRVAAEILVKAGYSEQELAAALPLLPRP